MNGRNLLLKMIPHLSMLRKDITVLVTLLGLAVCLFTAGNTLAAEGENGTLSGQVADVAQNPLPGVEVYVYSRNNIRRPADFISAPTDNEGGYRVTLPPGKYWVVARLRHGEQRFGPLLPGDKHSGAPLEIDIGPGENVEEDFVVADLEESAKLVVKFNTTYLRVEGLIVDKDGEPVDDAYVFANRNDAMKKIPDNVSASTDGDGGYILFLLPGTYYFGAATAFPPEPRSGALQKVIVDSDTKNINIILEE